jgi:hypothetical protein
MGLWFIPQVIYEHGGLWRNNIDKVKPLICPTGLSGNPTIRII